MNKNPTLVPRKTDRKIYSRSNATIGHSTKHFLIFFGIFALIGCQITGEKVFKAGELVDKVAANKDAWAGKEVVVSGYVSIASSSVDGKTYVLDIVDHRSDESERHVSCKVSARDLPEGTLGKTILVKGKIGNVHTQSYLNLKTITLDSCEIKK